MVAGWLFQPARPCSEMSAGSAIMVAMTMPLPPAPKLDSNLITRFRADLLASGWDHKFEDALPKDLRSALEGGDSLPVTVFFEGLPEDEADAATELSWLFTLAEVSSPKQVNKAFPTLGVEGAVDLGVIVPVSGGDGFRAALDVTPVDLCGPAWVVSDLSPAQTGAPSHPKQVLGVTGATRTLSALVPDPRDPADEFGEAGGAARALDLGCGSGLLALQMARRGAQVTATDISGRACQFTRFNALLNEVEVEVVQGSLFEPVEDRTFDLIVSNPPFVLDPRSEVIRSEAVESGTGAAGATYAGMGRLTYRDAGMGGTLMAKVLAGVAIHLAAGGQAVVLGNWMAPDPSEWGEQPVSWLEDATSARRAERGVGFQLDAYVVQRDLVDASQYAKWWLRDELGPFPKKRAWETGYRAWLEGFATIGVPYVGLGFIALALNEGEGGATLQVDAEYLPDAQALDAEAVQAAFNSDLEVEDWWETPFEKVAGVVEERTYQPGEADPSNLALRGVGPGSRLLFVPPAVSAFVGVMDGDVLPSQVVPVIAHLLDMEVAQAVDQIDEHLPTLLRARILSTGR